MQRLEHELARVESEIRAKQVRSSLLQTYQQQCNDWIYQQKAYQQMLTEIQQQDEARHTKHDDEDDSHTIQQLCQQLEYRLLYSNSDGDDDDTNESIKKYLTSRTTTQVLTCLRHYLDSLPTEIPAPSSQPVSQERRHVQHERVSLDQLVEMQQKEAQLEQRVQHLSQQVRIRVNHFYPDPNIQEALWQCIRMRAESRASSTELKSLKAIADRLESELPDDELENKNNTMEDLIHTVAERQSRVVQLMDENRDCARMIQDYHEEDQAMRSEAQEELAEELETVLDVLVGSIRKHVDLFHRLPLKPESYNVIPRSRDSTRLEQIKDALHPYLNPSRSGVIQTLGETLMRVNAFAHMDPPKSDIRETLESLVENWHEDLHKRDVRVPSPLANEDSIDAIAQAGNALKNDVKSKHALFLSQQRSKIRSQLQQLQQVDKDIESVNNIIKEGNLVKDGSIAFDLAYQDRTFQEWLEAVKK